MRANSSDLLKLMIPSGARGGVRLANQLFGIAA
jgi:hypothetical protein